MVFMFRELAAPLVTVTILVGVGLALLIDHELQTPNPHAIPPGRGSLKFTWRVPVGEQFTAQIFDLPNDSRKPITLDRLTLSGPGVGTTVRILKVQMLPLSDTIYDGVFQTYPPVGATDTSRACVVSHPRPVHGFVLPPGKVARALVLFQDAKPGRLRMSEEVTYTYEGHAFSQPVGMVLSLRVASHARPYGLTSDELRCLSLSRALPRGDTTSKPRPQ
jgi:hypothetical protein